MPPGSTLHLTRNSTWTPWTIFLGNSVIHISMRSRKVKTKMVICYKDVAAMEEERKLGMRAACMNADSFGHKF